MNSAKMSREFEKVEYPVQQLIRLGGLEIHITLLNSNIDVRILGHCYCVAIFSLSLL